MWNELLSRVFSSWVPEAIVLGFSLLLWLIRGWRSADANDPLIRTLPAYSPLEIRLTTLRQHALDEWKRFSVWSGAIGTGIMTAVLAYAVLVTPSIRTQLSVSTILTNALLIVIVDVTGLEIVITLTSLMRYLKIRRLVIAEAHGNHI